MTEQGRLGPPESCAADRPARAPGDGPGVVAAAIVRCFPSTIARDAGRRRGHRAPDPTLPSSPLRPVRRRRPHQRRRSAVRRHRRGTPRRARRPAPGQRRPARPAGRGGGRRARRAVPSRGPDAGRVALRRHVPQGPAPVHLRLRADVLRAGHGHRAHPARVLRAAAPRVVRARLGRAAARTDALGSEGGPLQGCSARPVSTRVRSWRCTATSVGARPSSWTS